MSEKNNRGASLRVALTGVLTAAGVALSFLEAALPDVAFLPPGAKLGLSNIAVMFAVFSLGSGCGIFVTVIKSGTVFLTRGAAAFFMSISGGLLSVAALCVFAFLSKKRGREAPYIGVSVLCAVLHNVGQVAAASIYTSTNLVSSYLPALILFGVAAGGVTGIVVKAVMPSLLRATASLYKRK